MRRELLEYYEGELTYLRQMGGEFARLHPAIAARLQFDAQPSVDPHVERLIEAFAFMAARVHRRIDDDFPLLTESLLNLIYPRYLRPIPAMTVVECQLDPAQGKANAGAVAARGTELVSHGTVAGVPLRFRTSYDVALWPLQVIEAEWRQANRLERPVRSTDGAAVSAVARIRLGCLADVEFAQLGIQKLRFFLSGDPATAYPLYELLASRCVEVQLRSGGEPSHTVSLSADRIEMVGFGPGEDVLPFDRRSVDGYRLLQEYLAFPEKFLFFDLSGLGALGSGRFGREVELLLLFAPFERPERQQLLELGVSKQTFRLGCTPAINLFERTAEPILLSQTRAAYPLSPDSRHAESIEVYSIDEVVATNPQMRVSKALKPLVSFEHASRSAHEGLYWSATRTEATAGQRRPSTMAISVVDLEGRLQQPEADVLSVRCTCTNFDLPSRLHFGTPGGDFEAVGVGAAKTVTALVRPTASQNAPHAPGQLWRMVSLLSLNYLSLSEAGLPSFQEILRLHNFADNDVLHKQIGAVSEMRTAPHFAMVASDYGISPARGTAVELVLDESQFTGGSAFLFGAVLDRFLAGYASMNSFAQLTVRSSLRKEPLNRWPPRAGSQVLL